MRDVEPVPHSPHPLAIEVQSLGKGFRAPPAMSVAPRPPLAARPAGIAVLSCRGELCLVGTEQLDPRSIAWPAYPF